MAGGGRGGATEREARGCEQEAPGCDTARGGIPAGGSGSLGDEPLERLAVVGPHALSAAELVALVLGAGRPGRSTLAHAGSLLRRFGSVRALAGRSPGELAAGVRIGRERAAALVAALELGRRTAEARLAPGARLGSSADVFRHCHLQLRDLRRERFLALLVDGRHRLIHEVVVSEGTLTASLVHPREAFAPAIRESAAALVFVHNHPSGDPTPSREDLELTERLVAVGRLVGIQVLDHIVVGDGRYHSFADAGRLGA